MSQLSQAALPATIILGGAALFIIFGGSHAAPVQPKPWYDQPSFSSQFDWNKMQAEAKAALAEQAAPTITTVPIQLAAPTPQPILVTIVPAPEPTTFTLPTLSTELPN